MAQRYTLPQLARSLGVTLRQAEYAADAYNVTPVERIANVRVYDEDAAERLRSALRRIGGRREATNV